MGEFQTSAPGLNPEGRRDPRLQPTPDYGMLGPGSDIAALARNASPGQTPVRGSGIRGTVLAMLIGAFSALLFGVVRKSGIQWSDVTHVSPQSLKAAARPVSIPASPKDARQLDRLQPQKQAEALLEMAVGNSAGAVDQISSRVDRWEGRVQWSPQIATLTTAALNSNDMRVRESGVEVELAAYGLGKNSASLDSLLKTAESPDHAQKVWALWALGLMANRGVETEHVVAVLTAHLQDSDVDSRRWAVEGLALSGVDDAVTTLLKTMHDDASPIVRERAACGIAESGLFTTQQRMAAVPQLVNYTDDISLDPQTHAWAFQALGDITHQQLPNNSAAWRNWYESK